LFSGEIGKKDCEFHLVNKRTGKYILSLGSYGNGPGELASPMTSFGFEVDKKLVWAFNRNVPKMVEYVFNRDSMNNQ